MSLGEDNWRMYPANTMHGSQYDDNRYNGLSGWSQHLRENRIAATRNNKAPIAQHPKHQQRDAWERKYEKTEEVEEEQKDGGKSSDGGDQTSNELKTLKDLVNEFADGTTAHGLPLVISSLNWWAKLFWFVAFFGFTAIFLMQGYNLLFEYFHFPYTTKVDLVTEKLLDFPAVTVCNMNRMRRSEMIGTRFEGLVEVDGGLSKDEDEWFFDFSSSFWDNYFDSSISEPEEYELNEETDRRRRSVKYRRETGSASATSDDSSSSSAASSMHGFSTEKPAEATQSSEQSVGSTISTGNSFQQATQHTETASASTQSTSRPSSLPRSTEPTIFATSADTSAVPTTTEHDGLVGGSTDVNGQVTSSQTPSANSDNAPSSSSEDSAFSSSLPGSTEPTMFATTEHDGLVEGSTDVNGQVTSSQNPTNADNAPSSSNEDYSFPSANGDNAPSSSNDDSASDSSVPLSTYDGGFDWRDFLGDDMDEFSFDYYQYYDWDVEGESDWWGFYNSSTASDFSDLADVANPTQEELRAYGHQAEDFILQCTFDKRNCNHSDFHQFQNDQYGNCYTFNHGYGGSKVRRTSKVGSQYGLHLTLFIEQPEYIGIFSPESGVRVAIHSHHQQPFPEDEGLTASPGQASSIGIRQSIIERLGEPWYNCTNGANTDHEDDFYRYSLGACKKQCYQKELQRLCGCTSDVNYVNTTKCSYLNNTQQVCKQLVEALNNDDQLQCRCPSACTERAYQTSYSSTLWPSEQYEPHLYERLAGTNEIAARVLEDVAASRNNLVRLRIYFEELNYQRIEQQPVWTLSSISGSVGGLAGLYVGISFITLLEIFIFCGKLFTYMCTCRCLERELEQ